MVSKALWKLTLVSNGGKRIERWLPHEDGLEAKDRAIASGRYSSGSLNPPRRIIISGLARIPQASRTPNSGPVAHGRKELPMAKRTLAAVVNSIEAGEAPVEQTMDEAMAEDRSPRPRKAKTDKAAPKVPAAAARKAAREKKAAAETPAADARSAELLAIRGRLEAAMPCLQRTGRGYEVKGGPSMGGSFSKDIRLIASSRVPRLCSGCSKLVETGAPLIQWTSNQPGNEKGYMFRGECCPPSAQDLTNSARAPRAARPAAKTSGGPMPLATLMGALLPVAELGAEPSSMGSVKVSAATVDLMQQAMAKAGISSQADFRRMAYGYLAMAIMLAPAPVPAAE